MPDPACPICRKPRDPEFRPFCSRRCAQVDLGRWLTGQYAVPGPDAETETLQAALDPPAPLE